MSKGKKPRHQQAREAERAANRRKYKSWEDVLAETEPVRCVGCGVWLKENMLGKPCRRCGAPTSKATIKTQGGVLMVRVTEELLRQGDSGNGGWNRAQLEILGISWPPKQGWKQRVIGNLLSEADAAKFLSLKRIRTTSKQLKLFPPHDIVMEGGK